MIHQQYVDMGREIHFSSQGKVYHAVQERHVNFEKIRELLQVGDYTSAISLLKVNMIDSEDMTVSVESILVKGAKVRLDAVYAEAYMYAKVQGKASEEALNLFFSNAAKNPEQSSRDDLSGFLAAGRMPITDRGTFLAYRYVNYNLFDKYTGTMDNMIGNVVSMPREECDSNGNRTCSTGLHACHHDYAASSRYLLVVEINPKDVVAVPTDYQRKKLRCCEFRVLCTLDYFKKKLLIREQAALGSVPVFLTEQTKSWNPVEDIPAHMLHRYNPVDPWKWAKE